MWKKGNYCSVCGNENWYLHYGKQYGVSSKQFKIELPYNPTIPHLGIYLKKMKTLTQKDICSPILIAALFGIAKIWKQLKCLSRDEWLNKLWCVCMCILLYIKMYIINNIILHTYYICRGILDNGIYILYKYVMECYLAIKKNDIFPFLTTWIDPEGIVFVQNKSDKERQTSYNLFYMWNLKNQKQTNRLIDTENRLAVARSRDEGWEK